jgi:hypothetical protein
MQPIHSNLPALSDVDILPAASGEDSYGVRVDFTRISSAGSSHSRPTSAEDNEEALLRAMPGPRSCGRKEFRMTDSRCERE